MGEIGQNNGLEFYSSVDGAIKSFEKKFKDKTKNDWSERTNFKPSPGKYTLIEMDGGGENVDEDAAEPDEATEVCWAYQNTELILLFFDSVRLRNSKFHFITKKLLFIDILRLL